MTDRADPDIGGRADADAAADAAAARIAALRGRGSTPAARRQSPAAAGKIIASGLSTTMVIGLVAVMGWHTAGEASETPSPVAGLGAALVPVAPLPPTPAAGPPAAAVPGAAVQAMPQPVVVDVAVPVARPPARPAAGGGATDATTAASR